MKELGINLNEIEDLSILEDEYLDIDSSIVEQETIYHEAKYYPKKKLIEDISNKLLGESDISTIKEYLEYLYDRASNNKLIDNLQEMVEYLRFKEENSNVLIEEDFLMEDFGDEDYDF